MRAVLLFGVAVGLAAVLAAAHYLPWVSHARVPARTEVITNGGRAEAFVIRLPADRLFATGTDGTSLRRESPPGADIELAADASWLLEQFKLRDVDGRVIGVAARHWTETDDGPVAAWCLVIPGRGALLLSSSGEREGAVEAALKAAGRVPGTAWNGNVAVQVGGAGGQIVTGSDEFAGLFGQYAEAWSLTGVSADGELRGTIGLSTRTYTRP